MNKPIYCANCGCEITQSYLTIKDNFLQAKYFDDPEEKDNVFCGQDCLCEYLSVREVYVGE